MTRDEIQEAWNNATPKSRDLLRHYIKFTTDSNKRFIMGYLEALGDHQVLSAETLLRLTKCVFQADNWSIFKEVVHDNPEH